MFTGLVEAKGVVERLDPDGDGARLEVRSPLAAELEEGGSIAVNGVCLTATSVNGGGFGADVMAETLERTTLGDAGPGRVVNLEIDVLAKYVEKLAIRP